MAKPDDPPEPGARDIDASTVLGVEEPGGEEPEPSKPDGTSSDRDHAARQPRATLTKGGRRFLAGLVVLVVGGGALYLFRSEIAAQYELRFHPEHYWASEVKSRRLSVKLAELQHQECVVDLLAARMKESISVARAELLGINSAESQAHLARETSSQDRNCNVLADIVKGYREKLADAERELEEAEENHQIAAGFIPRHSPGFDAGWRSATPTWAEITAEPRWQTLSGQDQEKVRLGYWRDIISPSVPTDELRRARRQFDELTATTRSR